MEKEKIYCLRDLAPKEVVECEKEVCFLFSPKAMDNFCIFSRIMEAFAQDDKYDNQIYGGELK